VLSYDADDLAPGADTLLLALVDRASQAIEFTIGNIKGKRGFQDSGSQVLPMKISYGRQQAVDVGAGVCFRPPTPVEFAPARISGRGGTQRKIFPRLRIDSLSSE